jgi:hypothetical protein
MKYKTYVNSVTKAYQNIFAHQIVLGMCGNKIPVLQIPSRLVGPLILDFLVRNPEGDIKNWFGYVIYACVPDSTEMSEMYEAENGEDACSEWLGDLYDKILLVNPGLSYEMVAAFQEPIQDDRVVYVNFRHHRRSTTPLW